MSNGAWFRLDALAWRSAKVASLPSPALRWLWIVTLSEAKLQRPGGAFGSAAHWGQLTAGAGGDRKGLAALVSAGLLEIAPALCIRCLESFHDAPEGIVVVHDWADFQINTGATRTRKWRERAKVSDGSVTHARVTPASLVTGDNDSDRDRDKEVVNKIRLRINGSTPASVGQIVAGLGGKGKVIGLNLEKESAHD